MNHTSHNVTIGDVAKAAGTSVSTVSRVLSGSTYPVSAAKRERVLHAANTLGYEPNLLGRMLKTNTLHRHYHPLLPKPLLHTAHYRD